MSHTIHNLTLFVIQTVLCLPLVRVTYLVALLVCNTASNNQNKARHMLLNYINKVFVYLDKNYRNAKYINKITLKVILRCDLDL